MERRELLKMITLLTGGALVGGDVFFTTGCNTAEKPGSGLLSESQVALLNEIAETIIPATGTPGAKDAKVGEFMNVYVTDCYRPDQQKAFTGGLATLSETCKKQFDEKFTALKPDQKMSLLHSLEKEAKDYNTKITEKEKQPREEAKAALKEFTGESLHYYTLIKQLTLLGFFTSEAGQKQALRYLPVPGKYDGAYPYKKGDKAWAL